MGVEGMLRARAGRPEFMSREEEAVSGVREEPGEEKLGDQK